ncbi:hypothetical protein NP233_g2371 [Leucocoprinus birnbaumii]|uniref:Uncharacterized protein n=1 Tax=Leucocoprinus birnbaumii TaxID=56174 RepID=A0AAD5VZ46_9AGAR|nr:hypothetical protein NP233_g2371 [Leucocoprinus birnbaumii]
MFPIPVHAVPLWKRGLAGLFGDGDDNLAQSTPDFNPLPEVSLAAVTQLETAATSTTKIRTTAHTSRGSTTAATSSNSPLSSTTESSFATASTVISVLTAATGSTTGTMTATSTPIVPEAPSTSAEEATQWKVIGIGIITVGLIATVILSIIFFDSWWNFLCDIFCGRRRKRGKNQGQETMVPDFGTRDWEFKLANEDGHRYPTMSSLADIAEGQGRKPPGEFRSAPTSSTELLSPRPPFLLDVDFAQASSGEPLARKNSTR